MFGVQGAWDSVVCFGGLQLKGLYLKLYGANYGSCALWVVSRAD